MSYVTSINTKCKCHSIHFWAKWKGHHVMVELLLVQIWICCGTSQFSVLCMQCCYCSPKVVATYLIWILMSQNYFASKSDRNKQTAQNWLCSIIMCVLALQATLGEICKARSTRLACNSRNTATTGKLCFSQTYSRSRRFAPNAHR